MDNICINSNREMDKPVASTSDVVKTDLTNDNFDPILFQQQEVRRGFVPKVRVLGAWRD